MKKRVAINGFGRIGRLALRNFIENPRENIEIVVANSTKSTDVLAYFLKNDSIQGKAGFEIEAKEDSLVCNGVEIKIVGDHNPLNLPWADMNIDIVLDCTGRFTKRAEAAQHLSAGAKKVIISAPSKDAECTVVMGVNEADFDASQHDVISNASCTTNSLAPAVKVMHDNFGIENLFATTIHAVTSSQVTVDKDTPKLRRGRSGMINIIPTTTGAAIATTKVIPELKGKMDAIGVRVPVVDGALTDMTVRFEKEVSIDALKEAFKSASQTTLKGILEYSEEELVSTDILGNSHSSIIDSKMIKQLEDDRTFKVLAWYDNEYGYSNRLIDLADYIAKNM